VGLSAVVVENVADDVDFECSDIGIVMEVPFDVPDACTDVEFECTDVGVVMEVPLDKRCRPGFHGCGSIKGNREKFPKRKEKKRDFLVL